jgi:hypothetical protein
VDAGEHVVRHLRRGRLGQHDASEFVEDSVVFVELLPQCGALVHSEVVEMPSDRRDDAS